MNILKCCPNTNEQIFWESVEVRGIPVQFLFG